MRPAMHPGLLPVFQPFLHVTLALKADGTLAADVGRVKYPDIICTANLCLPAWTDRKKYIVANAEGKVYSHIQQTVQDIQRHLQVAHGWENQQAHGGKARLEPAGSLRAI